MFVVAFFPWMWLDSVTVSLFVYLFNPNYSGTSRLAYILCALCVSCSDHLGISWLFWQILILNETLSANFFFMRMLWREFMMVTRILGSIGATSAATSHSSSSQLPSAFPFPFPLISSFAILTSLPAWFQNPCVPMTICIQDHDCIP